MDIKGKKLLILGGIALSCEIIKQAQKMGVYVMVTDYLKNSPGKKIADKSYMVSTTDVEAVVNLIQEERIDGVLTGFIDSMLTYYQSICEKAGLPCYATKEQIDITTNKAKFKELCQKFDVPVIQEYKIRYPFTLKDVGHLHYPVLVKPVDNSGARGVFICENPADLVENYEKSLHFSPSKQVIIERYVTAAEGTIYYVIQDGEIHLSAIADKYMYYGQNGITPMPIFYSFPSKHLKTYQKNLNPKVMEMFHSIGIQNGVILINVFFENGRFIFFDMGFRLGGALEYKVISKFNAINPMEMMVNYALTGSMYDEPITTLINPDYPEWGCNITLLAKPGQIGKIDGVNEVRSIKEVIDVVPMYSEGDIIPVSAIGTRHQELLKIFATADTKEELVGLMDKVRNLIKVYSVDGENMLLDVFEAKDLFE